MLKTRDHDNVDLQLYVKLNCNIEGSTPGTLQFWIFSLIQIEAGGINKDLYGMFWGLFGEIEIDFISIPEI